MTSEDIIHLTMFVFVNIHRFKRNLHSKQTLIKY